LGEEISEAVISVPAYFNDAQRRATKIAGQLAGLTVERLVSEPTAAAVAYGLHEKENARKYLVFDLGGGTFDVAILEFSKNIMEVRAVAGDNFLGGEDFNEILIHLFLKKHDLHASDLSALDRAALRKSAEITKRNFSAKKTCVMQCKLQDQALTMEIGLDEYEKACETVLARLKAPVTRAFSDASIKLPDLDVIVMVGGATRLPIVRSFVSKMFGRMPAYNINPDEAVALGAGVQAALKQRSAFIQEMILTDVCPYTLGTSISVKRADGVYQDGHYLPIIDRNSVIPASKVERVYTLHDNQRMIQIDILQGESRKSKENIYLGELTMAVPPGPAGREAVDIRYTYDINGILEAEATVISTGKTEKVIVEKSPGDMTEEEIGRRFTELAALKMHPRDMDEYKFLLERGERLYRENIGENRNQIAKALEKFEILLDKQNRREIQEAAAEIQLFFDSFDDSDF
jgi:molecular chaperone HscC